MNLHWERTLAHRWEVRIKPKQNTSTHLPRNFTFKYTKTQYHLNSFPIRNRTASNHSALYADNNFFKKSQVLTDIMGRRVESHSFTTVVVIASVFLFFTMAITATVIVFCRKRNSIFAFQKSEQETEMDYEMDEINTDIEYSEYESESESTPGHYVAADQDENPAMRPLVARASDTRDGRCTCQNSKPPAGPDNRGAYQQVQVTATIEKTGCHSNSDQTEMDEKRRYLERLKQHYYAFAAASNQDGEGDLDGSGSSQKIPIISITYADDPPAYDSIPSSVHKPTCTWVGVDNDNKMPQPFDSPDFQIQDDSLQKMGRPELYVSLPPLEEKVPLDGEIISVDLTPEALNQFSFLNETSGVQNDDNVVNVSQHNIARNCLHNLMRHQPFSVPNAHYTTGFENDFETPSIQSQPCTPLVDVQKPFRPFHSMSNPCTPNTECPMSFDPTHNCTSRKDRNSFFTDALSYFDETSSRRLTKSSPVRLQDGTGIKCSSS